MRDEELEDFEFPPDDPASFLDQLDSDLEDFGGPDDHPPTQPALTRPEIDGQISEVLEEELARLTGKTKRN
jgi:hypothetical protein